MRLIIPIHFGIQVLGMATTKYLLAGLTHILLLPVLWGQPPTRFDLLGHTDAVWALAFSSDSRVLYSGGADRKLIAWRAPSWSRAYMSKQLENSVDHIAIEPRQEVASVSSSTLRYLIRLSDGHAIESTSSESAVLGTSYSSDGLLLAFVDRSGQISVQDNRTRKLKTRISTNAKFSALLFIPESKQLLTCDSGGAVEIWDGTSGLRVASLGRHVGLITALAIGRNGEMAISAGKDQRLRLWNLRVRQLASEMAFDGIVFCAAFSPDSRCVALAGSDHNVSIWHPATKRVVAVAGHKHTVLSVCFSNDGKWLASGGGNIIDPLGIGELQVQVFDPVTIFGKLY